MRIKNKKHCDCCKQMFDEQDFFGMSAMQYNKDAKKGQSVYARCSYYLLCSRQCVQKFFRDPDDAPETIEIKSLEELKRLIKLEDKVDDLSWRINEVCNFLTKNFEPLIKGTSTELYMKEEINHGL